MVEPSMRVRFSKKEKFAIVLALSASILMVFLDKSKVRFELSPMKLIFFCASEMALAVKSTTIGS